MRNKNKYSRNPYLYTVISKVLIVILGFANSVFSTRYLGAFLKGEQSYIMSFVFIFSLILDFGIYQGYSKFRKQNIENLKEKFVQFFKLQFILTCLITVLIYFFMDIEYKYFLFIIPFQVLAKQMDYMCVIENISARNLVRIAATSFYTFILILIFIFSKNASLMLIFALIMARTILEIVIKIKSIDLRIFYFEPKVDFLLWGKALKIGFLPMLTLLLVASNYRIDIFILKQFVSISEIGIYSLAVNLGSQLWLIPDAFKDVLFNKNARKDDVDGIVSAIKFNVLLSVIIVFGFLVFGKLFITLLYEPEFINAYIPLIIIMVGNIFMILYKFVYTLLISNDQKKAPMIIFVIAVIINVALNYRLIPVYGINGAALASLVSYIFCGSMFLIVFITKYKIHFSLLLITKVDIANYMTLVNKKLKKS